MKRTIISFATIILVISITTPFVIPAERSSLDIKNVTLIWELPAVIDDIVLPELEAPSETTAVIKDQTPVVISEKLPSVIPRTLSVIELGEQYLHLDDNKFNRACFNKVIAYTPERFTEAVRENNIKALTIYGNVCVPANNLMLYIKQDGSFYDGPLAATAHNRTN